MKAITYIIFIFALVFCMTACTEEIDLKLGNTSPRLVVEGMVTSDTMFQFVRLSKSGDFFADKEMPGVSGAEVILSDGIGSLKLEETEAGSGFYITPYDYCGVPGRNYTLTIKNVDINNDGISEVYKAESYMHPVSDVDSIKLLYEDSWDFWKVLLYAEEPPGLMPDYYMFSLFVNDTLFTDQLTEVTIFDDRFIDGSYANGVWVHSFYNDDEKYALNPGDTVTLRMSSIDEVFYKYVIALQGETRTSIPLFSGPPANLPGNISNGALGYFTAFSNSYGQTVFTGEKE
jgi:hypothetical protein